MKTLEMREKQQNINRGVPTKLLVFQVLFRIHFKSSYQIKAWIMYVHECTTKVSESYLLAFHCKAMQGKAIYRHSAYTQYFIGTHP